MNIGTQNYFFQWVISKVLHKCIYLHFSLTNLVSLELRENMIQFLPQSMSLLVKLEILDLGSNNIKELVGHNHLLMMQSLISCRFKCLHHFSRRIFFYYDIMFLVSWILRNLKYFPSFGFRWKTAGLVWLEDNFCSVKKNSQFPCLSGVGIVEN